MNEDSAILLAQIKSFAQSLFDRLDAKIEARFSQLQRSVDALAIEQQMTHAIAVRLQAQELLKAKVVAADDAASREDRAAGDTDRPPNGEDHEEPE